MKFKETALILAGHGSTKNKDSSRHTRETAKRLQRRGIFKEVRAGFWKESPSFQEVFNGLEAKEAIVVPWFLTRGYFVEKVLSEQFSATPIPTRIVEPLGSRMEIGQLIRKRVKRLRSFSFGPLRPSPAHPSYRLRRLLSSAFAGGFTFRFTFTRALRNLLGSSKQAGNEFKTDQMSLLLASHGTPLHKGSRVAADGLAEELAKDGYRVSRAMFLEEEPKIADWRQVAAAEGPVMVLPHFLAGGLHGSEDVPGLLGIPSGKEGWYEVDGRWVGYGAPIGTPEEMEELILKMVDADRRR